MLKTGFILKVNGKMMKTIRKDEPADCSVKGGWCGREEPRGREEGNPEEKMVRKQN